MTVTVQSGSAIIPTGTYPTSYAYEVAIDTTGGESVTIGTADTANPRIDLIVAYVDVGMTATSSPANNPGMLKLKDVQGTPNSSPVVPNRTAIQSAIGAANPYIVLGQVRVNANVTQILTSNITDVRAKATTRHPVGFKAYMTTNFNYPTSSTFTKVPYAIVDSGEDIGSNFDPTNKRFIAPVAGLYVFRALLGYANNIGTNHRSIMSFYKNGTEIERATDMGFLSNNPFAISAESYLFLSAGDSIEVYLWFDASSVSFTSLSKINNYFCGYIVTPTT